MKELARLKNSPTMSELANRASDTCFYAVLQILPNPDPILLRLGHGEEIHDAIESDAHVMGELRMVRGDLLWFEHRLQPGGESRKDKRAFELCQQQLARAPAPNTAYNDVIWSMGRAPFRGHAVQDALVSIIESSYEEIEDGNTIELMEQRLSGNCGESDQGGV